MALATDIWHYRGLIGNLAQRELKARYKRSLLGWAWSLINPAMTLLTYAVVFGTFLKVQPPVAGNGSLKNFALYLFAGLVIWNFWMAVINGAMSGLIGAGPMLRKVYFPAECPVIASGLVALTQTLVETSVLLAIMAAFGNVSWTYLFVPIHPRAVDPVLGGRRTRAQPRERVLPRRAVSRRRRAERAVLLHADRVHARSGGEQRARRR